MTKIKEILANDPSRPTLLYTHYIDGIAQMLSHDLAAAGFLVGFFTGENKGGLEPFKRGELDVLIATAAICHRRRWPAGRLRSADHQRHALDPR